MKIKQEETGRRKGGKGHILSFSHHCSLFPDHSYFQVYFTYASFPLSKTLEQATTTVVLVSMNVFTVFSPMAIPKCVLLHINFF